MHLGDEQPSGDYMNSLNAGFAFFNVGYTVYSKRQLRLYPLIGIGGGWMNLKIREKSVPLSFDDILDNPERSVNLLTGGLLLNAAIGMGKVVWFSAFAPVIRYLLIKTDG